MGQRITATIGTPVHPEFGGGYNTEHGVEVSTFPTRKAIHINLSGKSEFDIALSLEDAKQLAKQLEQQVLEHSNWLQDTEAQTQKILSGGSINEL